MDLGSWLMLLGLLALGAQRVHVYIGEVRGRAGVDDDTRHAERLALVLALDSEVHGSVRRSVSFSRLQQCLSWNAQQLSEVLAYCEQAGWLRIEGEPGLFSHRGTWAALTANGASFAEWVRAGCPHVEAQATYTFNGPVADSNFAHGCAGDLRQVTGGGRIDEVECQRLVQAVRQELRADVLSVPALDRARSLLDDIEYALAEPEASREHLHSLAIALRDICLSAVGSGLWVAVSALVARLT